MAGERVFQTLFTPTPETCLEDISWTRDHLILKTLEHVFTTSTRDDRVHPAHARKMMANIRSMGCEVHGYENVEGGHGGAADNAQAAYMAALGYAFLRIHLASDSAA